MLAYIFQTVVISLSGVLSPGPITVAVIGHGIRSKNAGTLIAIGHAVVEFPVIALVYFGIAEFLKIEGVRSGIFLVGGVFLILMGIQLLFGSGKENLQSKKAPESGPLFSGILLTAGNAYFLLWWGTVGAALIAKGSAYGLYGLLVFSVAHWLCDLAWYRFLSGVTYKGSGMFGKKFTSTVSLVSGVFLLAFGVNFISVGAGLAF
jgi:threonine/homoserine/homoserine lactone efflux protein